MAVGEKSFSTAGKEAKRFDSTPIPNADYEFKVRGSEAQAGKKNEPGSMPYVSVPLEALGTASTEGGKNRVVYHMFFCSLKPGKDGSLMPERADGILGFARGLGEELELPVVVFSGNDCINPHAIVAALKARDGQVVRAHTKIDKAKDGYDAKARIAYFIEADASEAQGEQGQGEFTMDEAGMNPETGEVPMEEQAAEEAQEEASQVEEEFSMEEEAAAPPLPARKMPIATQDGVVTRAAPARQAAPVQRQVAKPAAKPASKPAAKPQQRSKR